MVNVTLDTPGVYPVNVSYDHSGCVAEVNDTIITDNFLVSKITGPSYGCEGTNILLKAESYNGIGTKKFKWSNGNVDTFTIIHVSKDTLIKLETKDTLCNYADSFFISKKRNPVIELSPGEQICYKKELTLDPEKVSNLPYGKGTPWFKVFNGKQNSFLWIDADSLEILSKKKSVKLTKNREVKFKVTDELGCFAEDSVQVTTYKSLDDPMPEKITVCSGQKFKLSTIFGYRYRWWNGNTFDTIQINGLKYSKILWVKIYNSYCQYYDSVDITVRPNPIIEVQDTNFICNLDSFEIAPKKERFPPDYIASYVYKYPWYVNYGIDKKSSFLWVDNSNGDTIAQGKSTKLPKGSFTFSMTDNYGCHTSDSFNVLYKQAIKDFLPKDTFLCKRDSIQLNTIPGYHFIWNGDNSVKDSSIWIKSDGLYTLDLLYGSCNWTDSIKIDPVYFPDSVFTADTLTGLTQVELTAPPGYRYYWSTGSNKRSIKVINSGWYLLQLTKGSCTESYYVYANIISQSVRISHLTCSKYQLYAPGSSATIWEIGGKEYSGSNIKVDVKTTGQQPYLVIVNKNNKVDTFYGTYNFQHSSVDLGSDTTLCENETLHIAPKITDPKGQLSYLWNDNSTASSYSMKVTDNVKVTVKVSDSVCTYFDTLDVFVHKSPEVQLQRDEHICKNDTLHILPLKVNSFTSKNHISQYVNNEADSLSQFKWENISSGKTISATKDATIADDGTFSFKLTNQYGCSGTDTLKVEIVKSLSGFLPNDTIICKKDSIPLSGLKGYDFYWNNDTSQHAEKIWARGNNTYALSVKTGSCTWKDSIRVANDYFPGVFQTDTLKGMDTLTLKAPRNYFYLWSNGSVTSKIIAKKSGWYWVDLLTWRCSQRDSVYVSITKSSGINEKDYNHDIKIYPNPVHDFLNIEIENSKDLRCQYKIISIDGKHQVDGDFLTQNEKIDVSNLSKGSYILMLINASQAHYFYFIKQ